MIERIRIEELCRSAEKRLGRTVSRTDVAQAAFPDHELGRPRDGTATPLSLSRKRALISAWDRGRLLSRCYPRHLVRLGRLFRVKEIGDLVEVKHDGDPDHA